MRPTGVLPELSAPRDGPNAIEWGVGFFPEREDFRPHRVISPLHDQLLSRGTTP